MESNWIPVAERLPEVTGNYLCTVETTGGEMRAEMVGHFNHFKDDSKSFWTEDNKFRKTIAWMSLPAPYRAEEPKEHEQQWKQSMLNTFLGGR